MWRQNSPGAGGCSGTCTDYTTPSKCTKYPSIIVVTPLVADFEATTVCYCTDTQFTNKTTGGLPPYYFSWDFNNNGTYEIVDSLTAANPSYHYGDPGTPTAKLRVKDSNATTNIDYQTHVVTVYENPAANFTSNSPQIYCHNITFNGTATGGTPSYTYYWDFDDGNTSTEQNTSHRYSAPGTYDVILTVTDANRCTNSTINPVVASGYTAGLSITKEANVTSATVGTVIGYTINVSNTGTANLTSVLVTDSLTGLNQTIPILAHGATQTFNTTHTVTEPEICAPIRNTATANGTDPCGNPVGPATASVIVTQGYTAGLAVVKTTNVTMPTVGTVIWYTINVSNTGNVNLSSVLVMDNLTGLNETMTILAPGSFHIFNTTYTVTESDICDLIENKATANGTDPCGYLTPTAVGVLGIRPWYTATVSVIKEANVTSATVGTVIGYTINVSNAGNVNLTSVLVTDNLTGLNETIPLLAPDATQIFNTTYTVTESDICGLIENTATANGTDPCGKPIVTSGVFSVNPTYDAELSIVKYANITTATVGTVIGYTINVSNTGNVNLTNVLVTDSLTGLSQTIPNLIPNASQTFNPSYTVTQADICEPINNTATANGTDPCGGAVGPVSASVSVPTGFSPALAITKTANVSSATVGTCVFG